MNKSKKPNWEKNKSILQGIHLLPAAFIAHSLDNSAITQNRAYTAETAKEVTKRLNKTFRDVNFKVSSVKGYINAIATNDAIISRWNNYKDNELPLIRQMILGK
jgi:hypothetical protein